MSSDIARLAARVAVLERQLARTTRTARMAYSSIEDGAIEVYDQDGTLRGSMGLQDDGTVGFFAHNGPPPPTPTPPVVEPALSGLTVTWPGTWTDAETAPLDLAEVQVHLSTTADAEPDTSSPVAAFHTAAAWKHYPRHRHLHPAVGAPDRGQHLRHGRRPLDRCAGTGPQGSP